MTTCIRAQFTALLLTCTSSLYFANSSAQAGDRASHRNSPFKESGAEQRVSVKQIGSIPVEEIVTSARQSFSSLRAEIDIAEKSLYNTYNDLNDLDEYDVECRKTDWAGTFIREQMCWPAFLTEMSARNVQDWRRDLDILIPVDHMVLLYGDKMDALRANVRRVAGEYPDAAIALLEVGKLQAAMKRKHDECMAQKPVLLVFRLCK
jgi:hypothetical protein